MPFAQLDEVTIEYERRGPADGPSVLLVAGLGDQRVWWPDELLASLTDEGFDVITFDNRDAGRSSVLDDRPGTITDLRRRLAGEHDVAVAYTLTDMAGDAVGLLDHLGIADAHVVGVSMGGMIAQRVALHHPDRVRSLTSIMSSTGSREVGQSTPEAAATLLRPLPATRDGYVEHAIAKAQAISSPTLFDPQRVRARAEQYFDRGLHPRGAVRQYLAILTDGDRTAQLASLRVPTLVIHGAQDPLIQPSGGEATAAAIPGARLEILDEMAHDLPGPLLADVSALIIKHVRAVENAR